MLFNISTVCTCVNFVLCTMYIQEIKCTVQCIFSVDELFNLFAGKPYQKLFKFPKKMSTIGFNTCLADVIECEKSDFIPMLLCTQIKLESKLDMF